MTTLPTTSHRSPLSSLGYRTLYTVLSSSLRLARKTRLIRDYHLDEQGLWYGLLIEAYAPRYDNTPASGLPRFARWKADREWFFKLGGLTVIVER